MNISQDRGLTVISMHQPWASLLVYGIKRIEGRGWSTEHTGRLWIHATSKAATQQEIKVLLGCERSTTNHSNHVADACLVPYLPGNARFLCYSAPARRQQRDPEFAIQLSYKRAAGLCRCCVLSASKPSHHTVCYSLQ